LAYEITYKSSVVKDLNRLEKGTIKRILRSIDRDLASDPGKGIPLAGQFKGLFRYRIGEYRVIFTKTSDTLIILRIAHRSKAYR